MFLELNTQDSTPQELRALANFFAELAGGRIPEAAPVGVASFTDPLGQLPPADEVKSGNEQLQPATTTRRRRTKAEIEAENAARSQVVATGPFYWSHPESSVVGIANSREELDAIIAGEPLVEEVSAERYAALLVEIEDAAKKVTAGDNAAPNDPAPIDPPEEFETVAATGGKTYVEADVQQLAAVVARSKGPNVVKDKIAELGATRIAALTAEQLNLLGAYLDSLK